MFKREKKSLIISISFAQIFILIGAMFAFSFVLGEMNLVSADYINRGPTVVTNPAAAPKYTNAIEAARDGQLFAGSGGGGGALPTTGTSFLGGTEFLPNEFAKVGYKPFGADIGIGTGVPSHIAQGLVWAAVAYFGGKMLGSMIGLSKNNANNLGLALGGGAAAFRFISSAGSGGFGESEILKNLFGKGSTFGGSPFLSAAVITIVIFVLLYKDEKTQTMTFQCLPWEPALGGNKCEECNKDSFRPCSEYRCKSLGQACDLVNKGTENEQCVWTSKGDVTSPKITPNVTALSNGLVYQPLLGRPVERGTKIVNPSDAKGCLQAFTALQFGLDTNEVAQCKLDYQDNNLTSLRFFIGGSNYYSKNHVQLMKLPSPNDESADAPIFKNDGTFDLFVRCQDANGNANVDVYVVEFCVNKGPDTTPPAIEKTSILDNSPVQYKIDSVPLNVYTNELAQCKWSKQDKSYDNMENTFACASSATTINADLLYTCAGNVSGVQDRVNNEYFFRCRDGVGNTNVESYKFNLRGSEELNIKSVSPNQTIFGSTNTVPVKLEVETEDGSDEGKAVCFYNSTSTSGFVSMLNTNSFKHEQILQLGNGNYNYNFKCVDAGGNIDEQNLVFAVKVDKEAPKITRIYKDQSLKVVTDEPAKCTYSLQNCNFNLDEGLQMEYPNAEVKNILALSWDPKNTYYIKCVDDYGNQPSPNSCNAIVSPKQTA
ncbi:MAG: hypothetical protein Q7R87_00725 [Nanoarchaeota archaeon]|nr:hypothetical protein [Nanoarchaeota archaeon]